MFWHSIKHEKKTYSVLSRKNRIPELSVSPSREQKDKVINVGAFYQKKIQNEIPLLAQKNLNTFYDGSILENLPKKSMTLSIE